METVNLKVKKRGTGKQHAKALRKSGLIPGVFYVKGEPSIPISTELIHLRPIVYTSDTKIISLEIEGESNRHDCILKEIKFNPVTDAPIHFDLTGIRTDHMMKVEVPIILKGQAIGAKEGGVIQRNIHKIELLCLPIFIPNHIELDITNLRLGKAIHLKDISIPNVEMTMPEDTVLVSCVPPRVTDVTKVAEGAEVVEPEVVVAATKAPKEKGKK